MGMMEARVYQLRRTLLSAAADYHPAAVSFDDVMSHPDFILLRPTREEAVKEWEFVRECGWVADIPGSGKGYQKITAAGLCQARGEGDLDPRLWGRHAF
jgi:hypothetical protein